MTKKHFEEAARIVRGFVGDAKQNSFEAFVMLFERFNSRFDRARFAVACGLAEEA